LANKDHLHKAGWPANSAYDSVQRAWLRDTIIFRLRGPLREFRCMLSPQRDVCLSP